TPGDPVRTRLRPPDERRRPCGNRPIPTRDPRVGIGPCACAAGVRRGDLLGAGGAGRRDPAAPDVTDDRSVRIPEWRGASGRMPEAPKRRPTGAAPWAGLDGRRRGGAEVHIWTCHGGADRQLDPGLRPPASLTREGGGV